MPREAETPQPSIYEISREQLTCAGGTRFSVGRLMPQSDPCVSARIPRFLVPACERVPTQIITAVLNVELYIYEADATGYSTRKIYESRGQTWKQRFLMS